jgi:hypothetical protein
VTTVFDTEELQARERDQPMFVPAVRRDVYKILRNPNYPGDGMVDRDTEAMFDTVLLAKSSDGTSSWDSFAFAGPGANPNGYVVLDDEVIKNYLTYESRQKRLLTSYPICSQQMLEAISSIGKITPVALAVTQAFEAYLSQLVQGWGEREAASLSVEFLIAFGNEMTKRLDVNNRIRSARLSPHEIQVLSTQPFCDYVDHEAVETFQGQDDGWRNDEPLPLASNYGMSDLGERNQGLSNQPNSGNGGYDNNFGRPNPAYGNPGLPDQQRQMGPNDMLQSNSRLRSYEGNSGPNEIGNNNIGRSSGPPPGSNNYGVPNNISGPSYAPQDRPNSSRSYEGNSGPNEGRNNNMGRSSGPPPGNNNYGVPKDISGPSYAPQDRPNNRNRNYRPPPKTGNPGRQGSRRDNAQWDDRDGRDDKGWYENF